MPCLTYTISKKVSGSVTFCCNYNSEQGLFFPWELTNNYAPALLSSLVTVVPMLARFVGPPPYIPLINYHTILPKNK